MAEVRYVEGEEIAAPVERVYAYRLDFTTLPDYNPNVSNLRLTGEGEYLFDLTMGGHTIEVPIRLVEAIPNERIVIETGPGYMARETCAFARTANGTRCVFDTTLTIPGDLDDATAQAVAAQGSEQVRIELDLMKKNLEE